MTHRAPGLAGALLASDAVMCEIVGDGWHVHPALMAVAIRAKGRGGVAAITDAVAVTGLPPGATGRLGDHAIRVGARWAELADGTIAGSITTMDAVFRRLVTELGLSVVDAAHLTSTTPATAVGRHDLGRLVVGHPADLVVLDRHFRPWQTWVGGRCAWTAADRPGVHVAEEP